MFIFLFVGWFDDILNDGMDFILDIRLIYD